MEIFLFFFGFQCVVEKVNKTNVLSFFGFFFNTYVEVDLSSKRGHIRL